MRSATKTNLAKECATMLLAFLTRETKNEENKPLKLFQSLSMEAK